MKRTVLREIPTGQTHDLTALLEEGDEISVGRENGNRIQLGKGLSDEIGKSKHLFTASRHHATITYNGRFYIKDHSKNGTKIHGEKIFGERGSLNNEAEIFFGAYGPVIYEEVIAVESLAR